MKKQALPTFTSSLRPWQAAAVLLWLPVHVYLLPRLLYSAFGGQIGDADLNFAVYAIGTVYMLAVGWRFLRRDFDPLCERPLYVALQIALSYAAMLLFNMAVSALLLLFTEELDNPNNAAVIDMFGDQYGKITAAAVFLAPILEEMIFRAGIFGTIRRRSRVLAYVVSIALFSLYHVWGYAISDPTYWLYLLQYVPAAYLICRCYESCNSIWGSIFFHMLINFISIRALTLLQELL